MGAVAQITDISFPVVAQGEIVSGAVTVENVGDEPTGEAAGFFGVLVRTLWDGQESTLFTYSTTVPGGTFTFDFHSLGGGIGTMPSGPAELEVVARRWLGDVWVEDDVLYYSIDDQEPSPPPSEEIPLGMKVFGYGVVAAAFVSLLKRR